MPIRAAVLSEDDQIRALTMIRGFSRYAVRDVALFALSHLAGMRVGEIAELDVEDVVDQTGRIKDVITLTRTKGKRVREVYVSSPALVAAIEAQVAQRRFSEASITRDGTDRHPLFVTKNKSAFTNVTMCQLFNRFYSDWLKIDGASGHSGRRTFITNLAERGFNLKHISLLAGHANVQTTAIYVESNPKLLRQMSASIVSSKVNRAIMQ